MRTWFIPLLILSLSGCAERDEARRRLEEQDERITSLQKSLQDLVKSSQRVASDMPPAPDLSPRVAQIESRLTALSARLDQTDTRVRGIETAPVQAAAPIATPRESGAPVTPVAPTPPQNKSPVVSVYQPGDDRRADFIVMPEASDADLFPVQISAIRGRRVETGTYPTPALVEGDETYQDEFGRERKRLKEVTRTMKEFGYEVIFSVENLTRTEKRITVAAGEESRNLVLGPGQRMEEVALPSQLGSNLRIEAGAEFKRYSIPYE